MTQVALRAVTKRSSLCPASTLPSQALRQPRAFPEWTLCLEGRVYPKSLSPSGPQAPVSSRPLRHRGETLPPYPFLPAAARSAQPRTLAWASASQLPLHPRRRRALPGLRAPSRFPSPGAESRTQPKSAAAEERASETQDSRAMHTLRQHFREGLARGGAEDVRGGAGRGR